MLATSFEMYLKSSLMDIQGDTLFNKATEVTLLLSLNIFIEKRWKRENKEDLYMKKSPRCRVICFIFIKRTQ